MSRWETDMRISTRWTPKLNCDDFVGVSPCRRWTIGIMTIFLYFSRRNVWIQAGSDFENEAFWSVTVALFELWRAQTKTKTKTFERTKNNSSVASFWYRSELLTLNSLLERCIWSWRSSFVASWKQEMLDMLVCSTLSLSSWCEQDPKLQTQKTIES